MANNNNHSESHTFRILPMLRFRNWYTCHWNANPCYQTLLYVYIRVGIIGAVVIGVVWWVSASSEFSVHFCWIASNNLCVNMVTLLLCGCMLSSNASDLIYTYIATGKCIKQRMTMVECKDTRHLPSTLNFRANFHACLGLRRRIRRRLGSRNTNWRYTMSRGDN